MGREFTIILLQNDWNVWAIDNDQAALHDLKAELSSKSYSSRLNTDCIDVSDINALKAFCENLKAQWQSLDLLINNAGVVFGGSIEKVPLENHLKTIDVNLNGLIATTFLFLPLLQKSQQSILIQMASVTGLMGLAYGTAYSASKWGVVGFSEALRNELKDKQQNHPHICIVCPSYIDTGMFSGTKHPMFMPTLESRKLAHKVLSAAQRRKFYVYEPMLVRFVSLLRSVLPVSAQDRLLRFLGVAPGMKQWRGRP